MSVKSKLNKLKGEQILSSNKKTQTQLWEAIADAMTDNKGEDIVLIDVSSIEETVTDTFLICHGNSTTSVRGIAENIIEKVAETTGEKPISKEGLDKANWIVLDYFDVVVHIFQRETREYYQLEDLWADTEIFTYDPKFNKLIKRDGE